jgi:SAM-dependent methyltransferase
MITVDFNRISIKPGDRILDIGCGSGRHTCEAARFDDTVVVGADIKFEDVLEAKERLQLHLQLGECRGRGAVLVTDILSLPFPDDYFDLVVCSEVLEHILDHRSAISEIIRVLKPGKNLVVSVPRYLPERICWWLSEDYRKSKNGHVRIYKTNELINLLKEAGTAVWSTHFAHSLHTPYWWLKCLVGPEKNDSTAIGIYHRLLVWDMMKKPVILRMVDRMLNPIIGKSSVFYLQKGT